MNDDVAIFSTLFSIVGYLFGPAVAESVADPPRFEHGFEAPQAPVISRLHYGSCEPADPPPRLNRNGSLGLCFPSDSRPTILLGAPLEPGIRIDRHGVTTQCHEVYIGM